jgi:hypothetical protein
MLSACMHETRGQLPTLCSSPWPRKGVPGCDGLAVLLPAVGGVPLARDSCSWKLRSVETLAALLLVCTVNKVCCAAAELGVMQLKRV